VQGLVPVLQGQQEITLPLMANFLAALPTLLPDKVTDTWINSQAKALASKLQSSSSTPFSIEDWKAESLGTSESNEDKPKLPAQSLNEIADGILEFVDHIHLLSDYFQGEGPLTRVYFWRDCLWPMVADNLLCQLKEEQPCAVGAMISRSTIGQKLFDGRVTDIMNHASQQAKGRQSEFLRIIEADIRDGIEQDPEFADCCNRVIQHLVLQGALQTHEGQIIPQRVLFIDTGYKTFPALLNALVKVKCPQVTPAMCYHTVKPGFEFLPKMHKKPIDSDIPAFAGMNDVGSYASFVRSGATFTSTGALTNLFCGDPKRVFHSMVFGLLLVKKAKEHHKKSDY